MTAPTGTSCAISRRAYTQDPFILNCLEEEAPPPCEDAKGASWCSKKANKCNKAPIMMKCMSTCGACGNYAKAHTIQHKHALLPHVF